MRSVFVLSLTVGLLSSTIPGSSSAERAKAKVVTAQAAARLLACLLFGKTLLDQIPIVNTLAGLALAQLAAAALVLALKLHGRQLNVELDLVVKAQVAVDICRSNAAGVDGADDRGGAVWQSPPLKRPSKLGTAPSESVTTQPHLQAMPMSSNGLESMSWPMATNTRSQGMTRSGVAAARGADAHDGARR